MTVSQSDYLMQILLQIHKLNGRLLTVCKAEQFSKTRVKPCQNRGRCQKKRICSQGRQFILLKVETFSKEHGETTISRTRFYHLAVYPFSLTYHTSHIPVFFVMHIYYFLATHHYLFFRLCQNLLCYEIGRYFCQIFVCGGIMQRNYTHVHVARNRTF